MGGMPKLCTSGLSHTQTHTHAHTDTHTQTHTHTHTHTCTIIYTTHRERDSTRAHPKAHTHTHTHTQIHSNAFMQHRMSQHQRDPAPGSQIIQSSCGLIIETSGVDSIFFTAVPHHRTATRDACLCIPKTSHADVLS